MKLKLKLKLRQTLRQTSCKARNNNTSSSAWGSFLFKLPAAVITVLTLLQGHGTVKAFEKLNGSWTHVLTFRRAAFSILDRFFPWLQELRRGPAGRVHRVPNVSSTNFLVSLSCGPCFAQI